MPAVCCTNIASSAGVNVDACRRNPTQYLAAGKVGEDVGRGCGVPLADNLEDEGDVVLWTAVGATVVMVKMTRHLKFEI